MTKKHDREDAMPTMIKPEPQNNVPTMINRNLPTMIIPESRTNMPSQGYQGGAYMKREHDDDF